MGVHGLWKLIEPSGKPVPLETLENKVLAVDISIWLHQAIKGFQDSRGASLPNAHLLGIYHRVCKLLYFKIKPIFVFDGGVPNLKKQTIAKRNQLKSRNQSEADKIQKQLINTLLKHSAITNVLSEKAKASIAPTKISPSKSKPDDETDLFALPLAPLDSTVSSSDEEYGCLETTDDDDMPCSQLTIHNIDTESKEFKSLPPDVRYDILSEVKETRKQSSWGRLHEMPTKSDDFSMYQMGRLLQRQSVQSELEKTEHEMGGHSLSLGELESLMKDQGVITKNDALGKRIASDENTRFLLIKDVKQAIEEAQKACLKQDNLKQETIEVLDKEKLKVALKKMKDDAGESLTTENAENSGKGHKIIADLEYEEDLQRAIQLSLECVSENSKENSEGLNEESFNEADSSFLDVESDSCDETFTKMTTAHNYMMEYSGLTPSEIARIIRQNCDERNLNKNVDNKSGGAPRKKSGFSNEYKKFDYDMLNKLPKKDISSFVKRGRVNTSVSKSDATGIQEIDSKSIEIVISPNKGNTDDLFSDIFNTDDKNVVEKNKKEETNSSQGNVKKIEDVVIPEKQESIEIVISPNNTEEDDLFKDVFKNMSVKENIPVSINEDNDTKDIAGRDSIDHGEVGVMSESDESDEFIEVGHEDIEDQTLACEKNSKADSKDHTKEKQDHQASPFKQISKIDFEDHHSDEKLEVLVDSSKNDTNDITKHFVSNVNTHEIQRSSDNTNITLENTNRDLDDVEMQIAKLHSDENVSNEELLLDKTKEEVNKLNEAETRDDKIKNSAEKEQRIENKVETSTHSESENKQVASSTISVTDEELGKIQENLRKEQIQLQSEKSLKERLAGNITDQMYKEAQELLQLFGVPYIIAPMEAEAQCAFLDEVNLTDGTITDDSDIWLFGGKTVYKNFFNQSKHVMEFRVENITHHFKLTRQQMILLALLVGSDYTTGLQGVGPVAALEILAAFPPTSTTEFSLSHTQLLSGLSEFRKWFSQGGISGIKRASLRSKLKNVKFSDNFPNANVVEAYLQPKVETSREPFSWAKPDIIGLIDFARQRFGWTIKKSEEILNPVVKRLEEKHSQKTIKDYFKTKTKLISNEPETRMSKRVRTAVKRIGNEPVDEEDAKPKQKRSRKKKDESDGTTKGGNTVDENEASATLREKKMNDGSVDKQNDNNGTKDKPKRRGRKKKTDTEANDPTVDEDIKILQATVAHSSKRVKEIETEVESRVKEAEVKKAKAPNLHRKEFIPQRERDKAELLKKKLKAIEVFRKSQKGPGYMKKRTSRRNAPKKDAGLSESSSDEN